MYKFLGAGLIGFSLPFFIRAYNSIMFLLNAEEGSVVHGAIPHAIFFSVIGSIPLFFGIMFLRKVQQPKQ